MKRWTALLLAPALLAGCAGLNTLRNDVSSFGEWPAERKPATYAFERLPSQQAAGQVEMQETLETAARPALDTAGFKPAPEGSAPDVLVQLGARISRTAGAPWDDPFWWRGGFGYYGGYAGWRHSRWAGPRWGLYGSLDMPRYEREVALLVRDRSSGKPLYETRASSDGYSNASADTLRAMFDAALKDFPATGINPRSVVVQLPG